LPGISEDGVVLETEALPPIAVALGVFASLLKLEGRIGIEDLEMERQRQSSPWNSLSGSWINGGNLQQKIQLADGTTAVCTSLRDGSYQIGVLSDDSQEVASFHVNGTLSTTQEMHAVVDHRHRIALTTALHEVDGVVQVCMWPQAPELSQQGFYFWQVSVENPMVPSSLLHGAAASVGHGMVKAPMPGKISRINFAVGDTVEEGDVLLLMEAMKMEHTIVSPVSGILQSISYKVGDVVADGAMLAVVESEDGEEPAAV
jgi:biotin carboxyl carrier protein